VTGQAVVCFGCGARIPPDLGEPVGDAMFCPACLGRMLRRVDERGTSVTGGPARQAPGHAGMNGTVRAAGTSAGPDADRAPVASAPPADAPCFVCGEPLGGDSVVELRGFAICPSCAHGLIGDDAAPEAAPHPKPDTAVTPGPEPTPARIQVTPGSGTEWCSRCGRAMPGPGSYQLLDGRPHCAACVAARARAADAACDACTRIVTPSSLRETDGFQLCAACHASDPELAVALARARHQRRLARASRRILDGDGDDD